MKRKQQTQHEYTGSPQFVMVCFSMNHNNDSFETRRPKISKNKKIYIYKKCATINTTCDVRKQHSQSEKTAILIYHPSQSGMRLIKLLNKSHHV